MKDPRYFILGRDGWPVMVPAAEFVRTPPVPVAYDIIGPYRVSTIFVGECYGPHFLEPRSWETTIFVKGSSPEPDTYEVTDGTSITCLKCKRTSHNPGDIKAHYCSLCRVFHDNPWASVWRVIYDHTYNGDLCWALLRHNEAVIRQAQFFRLETECAKVALVSAMRLVDRMADLR